ECHKDLGHRRIVALDNDLPFQYTCLWQRWYQQQCESERCMDTLSAGNLLREVARLHVHTQREQVAYCTGTTSTQCLILTEVGRKGSLTLAELGRHTSLDKGWLSRAVEMLVQQGLLTKALGDHDRRTIRIALSKAGETRFRQ